MMVTHQLRACYRHTNNAQRETKAVTALIKLGKVRMMGCIIVSTIFERPSAGPNEALHNGIL